MAFTLVIADWASVKARGVRLSKMGFYISTHLIFDNLTLGFSRSPMGKYYCDRALAATKGKYGTQ